MAIEPVPPVAPVPTPLIQRGDRATFSDRVDIFVTWLEGAPVDFKALGDNVLNNANEAFALAAAASGSASAAAGSATAASGSATAAAASAVTAGGYATAAATSATNAATSETNAAASAAAAAAMAAAFTGTSASSVTIGTGAKTFMTQTGEQYTAGVTLSFVSQANVTNFMIGQATSYNSGTGQLDANITVTGGSGTFNDWNISLAGVQGAQGPQGPAGNLSGGQLLGALDELKAPNIAAAATTNVWALAGNSATLTGTTPVVSFGTASQAGAKRTLIAAAATPLTNGANLLLPGNVNYTCSVGDRLEIYAETTTQARVSIWKADGTPVVSTAAFNNIEVLNISANTSLTSTSKNVVRVTSTVRGASVLLPSGTSLAGLTGMFVVKNIGDFTLPVRDQDGNLLSLLPKGATGNYTLEDVSTVAGVWAVIAPESRPAQAFAAATVEAVTAVRCSVSEIPGIPNKALIAWATSTVLKVAIATRNPTTNVVTVGAALTITSSLASSTAPGLALKALTSTTGMVAGPVGSTMQVWSLSLNTGTDTVTTTGNATFGTLSTVQIADAVQQLDATRMAWLTADGSVRYINIATYAATPTAAQTSLAASNVNDQTAAMVHVGSGTLAAVAQGGWTMITTSGNAPTFASTAAANILTTQARAIGFSAGVANRAVFHSSPQTTVVGRDLAFTVTPSGTTLPAAGPDSPNGFGSVQLYKDALAGAVVGSSYCMLSGDPVRQQTPIMRVMRYTDAQLSEICSGGIEGNPACSSVTTFIARLAPVSGHACIAIGLNASVQPQVYSVEVIKA